MNVLPPDLRFSLSGTVYFNNSVIPITDIGTEGSSTPMVCITDLRPCCRMGTGAATIVAGHWYYPNGTEVEGNGTYARLRNFFRTRGYNDGTVNLFRRNNGITSPFGRYCCEIPDTNMVDQTLCANLGKQ